jgi:hypothetical protein
MENQYLEYRKRVIEFLKEHQEYVSDHIVDVIVSVCMTRDNVRTGGSFVQAVVNNHLYEAVLRADADYQKNLRIITISTQNCYINEKF